MIINSTNPYQNLSLNNILQGNSALNLSKNKENLEPKITQNIENLSVFNSYASEFSFRIDENGFFEKDLNKIANIPLSYDINIKSVRQIAKELISQNENLNYNKIDLPYLLNSYHSSLKAVNSEFSQDNNENLSRDKISKLSAGFSTQSGEFLGEISRIYGTSSELEQAFSQNKALNTLMLDNKITSFGFDKALNNTSNNEILKPYITKNSEVSKAGLLMNFIYQDIKTNNENELNFFMKPVNLDFSSHQNLQKILKNEMNVEDFLKENNEKKMSFDLYLYVNGVDKKTSSKEKLSILFQQYVNYQKDMNLKEFADSSSIFQLYTNQIKDDFAELKKDFNSQTSDKERLIDINESRNFSLNEFLSRRQKQANLNKILNSYMSVMA